MADTRDAQLLLLEIKPLLRLAILPQRSGGWGSRIGFLGLGF